ncbi:hypothetical protein Tco_0321085 [Tanacetum coccineum]
MPLDSSLKLLSATVEWDIALLGDIYAGRGGGGDGGRRTVATKEKGKGDNSFAAWSDKLDDALWPSLTSTGTKLPSDWWSGVLHSRSLCYGKDVSTDFELVHIAYWALKHTNFVIQEAG